MINAPSISTNILDIYDSASKGESYLLATLCRVLNCQTASIQVFPYKQDPFKTSTPLSYSHSLKDQARKHSAKNNCISPSMIKLDDKTAAIPFKANTSISCYLFIDLTIQSTETFLPNLNTDNLYEHIIEALNISYKITQQENDLQSIHYVLDHYPMPILAIDENLDTFFSNLPAQQLLQKVSPSSSNKHVSLLTLCQPDKHQLLKQALLNSLKSKVSTSNHLIIKFNEAPLTLIITNTAPNVFRHLSGNNTSWVYLLNPDFTNTLKLHPEFQALHLSATEIELSCALFNGHSLSQVAEQRHVSKQTVRKQLQSILRKTNCESQEHLMLFLFRNYIHYGLMH